jgi:IS4 transposase
MARAQSLPRVTLEFEGASLGDARRSARLLEIADALDRDPRSGFPQAMGSEAELEAFYRFINNDAFSAADILAPHVAATVLRAREKRRVVVVHDTTPVAFGGLTRRDGLGTVSSRYDQGFIAHAALMLAEDGTPLGVAHLETLTRSGAKRRTRSATHRVNRNDDERESLRWVRAVDAVEHLRDGAFDAVHVTDAEGDFFELLAGLHEKKARFVIRAGQLDRIVDLHGEDVSLRTAVDEITPRLRRDIQLSERRYAKRNVRKHNHPERAARSVRLAIGATTVLIKKTKYSNVRRDPFRINVVRVWEEAPPAGEPPVEWILLTTDSTDTRRDLGHLVDTYRLRWTIEEFFKALKTGCSLERRQIESYDGLRKVLALFAPIAYRLLLLRGLERAAPNLPATSAFSTAELHLMQRAPSNRGLRPARTIADAMLHLARLGGHLRNNGRPGWQTLSRGYEKLLTLRMGWQIAHDTLLRSDQS